MLVATNVFVDYLREHTDARDFLLKNENLITSLVVVAEIISGFANKVEMRKFDKLLASLKCEVVLVNELISERAMEIFRANYFGKGIGFEDCLIAATALELDEPLVTLNVKHFRFIGGLDVVKPY